MARRFASIQFLWAFVLVVCCGALVASAASPTLLSASSRLKHGSAGSFDIALPLSGSSGIECRSVSGGTTLVLNFDQPIWAATATVSPTSAKISGSPTFSGNAVLVKVTGLKNATAYALTLTNVTNTAGEVSTVTVSLRTLLGDVNESGSVTAADVNAANGLVSSNAVTASNFTSDVNLVGSVTKSDVTTIKQQVGASVAGGASGVGVVNGAPVVTPATGSTTLLVATMGPQSETLTTPSLGYGSATFVLSADQTNGILRFSYANLSSPKVAEHIHGPGGPGVSAGIIFDIDNPAAPSPPIQPFPDGSYQWIFDTSPSAQYTPAQIVNFILTGQTYINIHTSANPGGEIRGQFTVAVGSQTFTPPAAPPAITINPPTQFDAVRFLTQAGFGGTLTEVNALSNAHAANASTAINDWLTAQFTSQLPISYNPPATYNLTPGTAFPYGGTQTTYTTFPPNYVGSTQQPTAQTFSPSSMYLPVFQRITQVQATNNNVFADTNDPDRITECWWHNAVAGTDQLRQRVATALSEIIVVSSNEGTVNGNTPGLATWYDMLADDAFVNFRQLMYDFTLHPIMGEYLNMRGNNWSLGSSPNENYAREIMQLFTVGLYMLQPDGTLMLDSNGQPIPTYSQPSITNMAHVFTGWNASNSTYTINTFPQNATAGQPPVIVPFVSFYQKPMVVTAGSHSQLAKTLLSYPGAPLWPTGSGFTTDSTTAVTIPANTSQTVTTANTELNFALDNIFNHPNVGPFICKQLIQRLTASNPSNAYVYRVAQVFDDDRYTPGATPADPITSKGNLGGVRGNMQAVIQAILTDYEARSPALQSYQFNGRTREPMIRIANILRPMHAFSKTTKWRIGTTDNAFGQTILRSPTVFNFFSPTYAQPGPVSTAGDVSPEFDIIDETTISNIQNMIYTGIYSNGSGLGFVGDNYGSDVYVNHSSTGTGLIPLLATFGLPTVVNQIGLLMNGAPLDTTTKNTVLNFISGNVAPTDVYGQISAALHLISTSPKGATQQ